MPHTVGERVAHARRLLGVHEGRDILAPDLAARVGVTINAVYAWEAGTVPGKKNLERLADELGVTPEWIHYGVTSQQPTSGTLTEAEAAAAIARSTTRRKSEGRPTVAEEAAAKKPADGARTAGGGRRHPKPSPGGR